MKFIPTELVVLILALLLSANSQAATLSLSANLDLSSVSVGDISQISEGHNSQLTALML